MAADLSEILVVDVESTCWNDDYDLYPEERELKPAEMVNEVIEIGVAALNIKTRGVTQRASIVIKPRYSKVSRFCTELTGWTQEQIDEEGLDIVDALKEFENIFKPEGKVWCSYGEYDRWMLSSTTKQGLFKYGIAPVDNPFDRMRGHFNIKTLMALKHKLNREMGMAKALNYYGLKLEGRHHNGADDAWNIAQIASKVLS